MGKNWESDSAIILGLLKNATYTVIWRLEHYNNKNCVNSQVVTSLI